MQAKTESQMWAPNLQTILCVIKSQGYSILINSCIAYLKTDLVQEKQKYIFTY